MSYLNGDPRGPGALRSHAGGHRRCLRRLRGAGTRLDPSGLVKGWAIETAAEILESYDCANFCINVGGDIALRGRPTPDTRWRVGTRHPDRPEAWALVIEGDERLAVATSATYERGAHIVDPHTGQPTKALASSTVVGPDLTVVDSHAMPVFVMGLEGIAWIDTRPGYDAYLITNDDQTYWSSGFAQHPVDVSRVDGWAPPPES